MILSMFEKTGSCAFVMDTKYKSEQPSATDIQLVTAYAETKDCKEAILIYPEGFGTVLRGKVGQINIRRIVFPLNGDLDQECRIADAIGKRLVSVPGFGCTDCRCISHLHYSLNHGKMRAAVAAAHSAAVI